MFEPTAMEAEAPAANTQGSYTTLHAHGNGTYHSVSQAGKRIEHPSIGHALSHLAKVHSDGDHVHVLGHETGYTSHHVLEGGKVQGPHEHKNLAQLKKSMGQFLDEEAQES